MLILTIISTIVNILYQMNGTAYVWFSVYNNIVSVCFMFLIFPFYEELLFRYYIPSIIGVNSNFISSLLFALMHYVNTSITGVNVHTLYHMTSVFYLGMYLSQFESITIRYCIHIGFNIFKICMLYAVNLRFHKKSRPVVSRGFFMRRGSINVKISSEIVKINPKQVELYNKMDDQLNRSKMKFQKKHGNRFY